MHNTYLQLYHSDILIINETLPYMMSLRILTRSIERNNKRFTVLNAIKCIHIYAFPFTVRHVLQLMSHTQRIIVFNSTNISGVYCTPSTIFVMIENNAKKN